MAASAEGAPWLLLTISESFDFLPSWREMEKRYHTIRWKEFVEKEEECAEKIEAILVMPSKPIDFSDDLMKKLTNVKIVQTWGTGTDHMDLKQLRKYNRKVGNTPNISTDMCANYAFTLLLMATRRLPENMSESQGCGGGSLHNKSTLELMGRDVTDLTLGIVGMGKIGFEVAKRACSFKMKILYYNRNRRGLTDEEEINATYYSTLAALLPQVDYLILTAPLTPSTQNLMSREQFQTMKHDSIIINIARGGLIDHEALVEALQRGAIGGAALDVTEPEPLPGDHPLRHMKNVIITNHIATLTEGALDDMLRLAIDNMQAAIEGRELLVSL